MELDDPSVEPDPDVGRMGPLALLKDVVLRPSAAMRRLDAQPGRRWWLPLTLLAVLSALNAAVLGPRVAVAAMQAFQAGQLPPGVSAEAMSAMPAAGTVGMLAAVTGVIGAVFGVVVGALLAAAILHFVGTVFGGQQTFNAVLTTTSWARLPLILRSAVQLAWFGSHAGEFDANLAGLSGLVADAAKPAEGASNFWAPLLARVEVWHLWYLFLLVLAVRATSKVTRGRALLIVAVYVLLGIGAGLIGTAIGRAMSGFAGG